MGGRDVEIRGGHHRKSPNAEIEKSGVNRKVVQGSLAEERRHPGKVHYEKMKILRRRV